jgi:hypothetical protein
MGLLSKIWKGVKNVFRGILEVFKPILEPISKFLDSKVGKALMIGLSIFTLGSAMIAGYGAFNASMAAGNGFINSFVEGGKQFVATILGKGDKANPASVEQAQGVGESVNASQTLQQSPAGAIKQEIAPASKMLGQGAENATMAAELGTQGTQVAGTGGMGGMPNLPVEAPINAPAAARTGLPSPTTGTTGGGIQGTTGGKWLEKAKTMAGDFVGGVRDFAETEGGGQVVGSLIQGVGNYYTEKDRQEFQDRIRREWADPSQTAKLRQIGNTPAYVPNSRRSAQTAAQVAGRNTSPYFARPYVSDTGIGG